MWRFLGYWLALSIVTAAGWSLVKGVSRAIKRDFVERPENDDQVRERMERVRDAGNEVGL